jgi:hypothetical protein
MKKNSRKYLSPRNECYFCHVTESINVDANFRRLIEVHHIVERNNGGSNCPDNKVPLCSNCHSKVHLGLIEIDKYYNVGYAMYLKWKNLETNEEFLGPYRKKYPINNE